jgi:hypothetical protein
MQTPKNEVKMPKTAKRDGFSWNIKDDTNIDQTAVVFTSTVAFKIVVSKTAETKRIKCKPRRKPRTRILGKFVLNKALGKGFFKAATRKARNNDAIIKRQRAIEKTLSPLSKRIKTAAVPKSAPPITPSASAVLLSLFASAFNCNAPNAMNTLFKA